MMRIAVAGAAAMLGKLREALGERSDYHLLWMARSGEECVRRCTAETPELLMLDPNIHGMKSVEVVRKIMRDAPCPILLVTEALEENASKIFEAMGSGALDAVSVPAHAHPEDRTRDYSRLHKKIRTIERLSKGRGRHEPSPALSQTAAPKVMLPPLIAIGSSAGGPKTLAALFSRIPVSFQGIILVVQHVDKMFSAGFVEWLDAQTALRVRMAVSGDFPSPGNVYVAESNAHLVLTRRLTFSYNPEPRSLPYRPSVDVLFKSLAEYWPVAGKAIVLTGMGRDGAEGLACLRKSGWHTIAQDRSSSIVYGMPKAAKALGAAVEILSLNEITKSLLKNS